MQIIMHDDDNRSNLVVRGDDGIKYWIVFESDNRSPMD